MERRTYVDKACYRSLRGYKYQLVNDYAVATGITPPQSIETSFVSLDAGGRLAIRKGYAWDGPSGPTIDTKTFMRGSLVHDALYQLLRLGKLDRDMGRRAADDLLQRICLEDGMSSFRAWYVHKSVRWFAAGAAAPAPEREDAITCLPE